MPTPPTKRKSSSDHQFQLKAQPRAQHRSGQRDGNRHAQRMRRERENLRQLLRGAGDDRRIKAKQQAAERAHHRAANQIPVESHKNPQPRTLSGSRRPRNISPLEDAVGS